jgi:Predicted membrane protein
MLSSYFSFKYKLLRRILAGEPTILIKNGKVLEHTMSMLDYSFDYLVQQLRQKNVFDIGKVEFAILEPSGELSIHSARRKWVILYRGLVSFSKWTHL